MKKHILLIGLLFVGMNTHAANPANPASILGDPRNTIRSDDIPAGEQGYYYIPGTSPGADSMPTPYYGKTFKMGAGFSLSLDRQCGELNPFKRIAAQLKANVKRKVQEFKAFISSLPQLIASQAVEYALAKINPDLYQLTQLNIDEYFELFQINIKTCEQVRAELMASPDANPFDKYMQIAIGDEWKRTIGTGGFENTHEVKKEIAERAQKYGIEMADGKRYGGEGQDPIDLIKSLATAGINLITGRNSISEWDGDVDTKEAPISQYFKNAKELVEFIEDIYGSQKVMLANSGGKASAVETKPGVGVGRAYSELRNENVKYIRQYADRSIDRKTFEEKTHILIPPAQMDDIRLAPAYHRDNLINDLAKQEAINTLITKLQLAQDAMRAGVMAPDLRQSSLAEVANERFKEVYYQIMDDIAKLGGRRYQ